MMAYNKVESELHLNIVTFLPFKNFYIYVR